MRVKSDGSSYEQALATLSGALRFGISPTLENTRILMAALNNPQDQLSCIQIAGTNGKTSTARFVAALLRSQGKMVGLYTSPELVHYEERVEINGAVVTRDSFAHAINYVARVAEDLIARGELLGVTEFELLTAAAFVLFAKQTVDYAVLEVGLGGRWDATSVVNPQIAVVCGVDFDHTEILGESLEAIAAEKVAIIKQGTVAVLGQTTAEVREIFLEHCAEVDAKAIVLTNEHASALLAASGLKLKAPAYQSHNLTVALVATEAALGCSLDYCAAQKVLDGLVIPGRFEILRTRPLLLIDAAHNPQSARILKDALVERFGYDDQGHLQGVDTLLLAVLQDKDASGIVAPLVPLFSHIVVTRSSSPRARDPQELASIVNTHTDVAAECFSDVASALDALLARKSAVVATGSITLAGDVCRVLNVARDTAIIV